ncbi:MAG: hypothetical protein IPK32_15095 [Verrucomicrobiaceae bacterium]|nr:hypothetical protein [Verrucomicrobiaceae bacterium]
MPAIPDADPVHRTKHQRLAGFDQDHTPRTLRVRDRQSLHIVHRHPDLWRGIRLEDGDAKRILSVEEAAGEEEEEEEEESKLAHEIKAHHYETLM